MIGKEVSHYKITEKVSTGGMSVVYKAQDLTLDRTVAVKVFDITRHKDLQKANDRFLREAQIISKIDHQNVVTLYEVVREGSINYIVMQYVEGATLREKLTEEKIECSEALRIAHEVGQGLKAAHELGIVHRDIKPENVMITASGQSKILDFGIAHLVDRSTLTERGRIIGTLPYMAPEQIHGEDVDERSDVYALGVLLFEMLCGRVPFDHKEEVALFYKITNVDAPSLRGLCENLPPGIDRIVSKALKKNPAQRYQSVSDMLHDLSLVENLVCDQKISSSKKLIARKAVARRPSFWTGVVILLALAALTFTQLGRDSIQLDESPRIMVMKWVNTDNLQDMDWLSGAIMDGLIAALGKLEGYKIISRQTVYSVIEILQSQAAVFSASNVFGAAREIGADYLITGSFSKSNGVLNVICELSNLKDENIVGVWSMDITDLQKDFSNSIDRFASDIAEELGENWSKDLPSKKKVIAALTSSLDALKYYQQALEFYEVGNTPSAVEKFGRAAEIDPNFTAAYLFLSRLASTREDQERNLMLAMKHRHASPSPLREIVEADYYKFKGATDDAIGKYESVLAHYPEEVSARIALASMYLRSRRFHEAAAEYTVLQNINPFDTSYYPMWWLALAEIGRSDKAEALLVEWHRGLPFEERPLRELINYHQVRGNYETGLTFCDTLASLKPGADTFFRASLLYHLGRIGESKNVFVQLIDSPDRFFPKSRAYSWLAYLAYENGEYQRGMDLINQALEDNPGAYNFWVAGLLKTGTGDFIAANEYADRIKSLNVPVFEDSTAPEALFLKRIYFNLKGAIALAQNNPSLAIRMYQNSVHFSSRVDEIFFRVFLCRAFIAAGKQEEAVKNLERILQLNPNSPEALLCMGRARIMREEYGEAIAYLNRLDKLWHKADADYVRKKELDRMIELCAAEQSE